MYYKLLLFTILASFAIFPIALAQKKVVCYYESWKSYAGFQPEDFDAKLCTHVNYAFIGLNSDGSLKPNDQNLDINQKLYQRVSDMKKRNGNLKVLFSVGGADQSQTKLFSEIAADANKRKKFINSANDYIKKYKMDGIDIDWELPLAKDKNNFVVFLKEIQNNFKSKGWLLTAAVSANPGEGYDVPQLNKFFSFINVMTYDFYGPWSKYTGFNAPLYAGPQESQWEKQNLNFDASFKQWTKAGASPNKLIMGLAFYGRSFTLADPNQHGVHAPIKGAGVDDGAPQYNMICSKYKDWTTVWDDVQKVPYKYKNNQWIGFDNERSLGLKVDYIKQKNAGGAMIWAIDGDDVKGICGPKQALLKGVQKVR